MKREARGRSRGQALAEFAIVVPILMIIFAGAIDFGRLMQARVTAEAATRTGASWAAGILANATLPLSPVYALSTTKCGYGPVCNMEARACDEAAGFPGYSGGPALQGAGANPVTYHDCAHNYASSTNSVANVCSPSGSQSNPFFVVTYRHADGTTYTPSVSSQATIGDTIEMVGTYCFTTLISWPGVPHQITFSTTSRYTVQP